MDPITSINDPRYIKALGHPLRVRILAMLEEEESSPVRLSEKLGASLGTVAYHVRTLHDLGMLEHTGQTPRRGAVEHHYKARERPAVTNEMWDQASPVAKQAALDAAITQAWDYTRNAVAAGGFDRGDAHMSRTGMRLDAQGWAEIGMAFERLLDEVDRIDLEARERLLAAGEEAAPMDAGLVMMLFEATRFTDQPNLRAVERDREAS